MGSSRERRPHRSAPHGPPEGTLLLIGANHKTANLEERERLLRRATYSRIRKFAGNPVAWGEVILLTTCNRIEVYLLTTSPEFATRAVSAALEMPPDASSLYILRQRDAASHLLRVASGLDSLAQGEGQISAQVRRAARGRPPGVNRGSVLAGLFERAARVAPRIQELAGLPKGGTSASHAAIRFIEQAVPVVRPTVILLGSGKMAHLAAGALRGRAAVQILTRSFAPEKTKTGRTRRGSVDRRQLRNALLRADVLIAATSARRPLVGKGMLQSVLKARKGRPLWLIDLGFPRNVAPSCALLPGVTCVDIDGLAPWGTRAIPPAALARAEDRIRAEAGHFVESLQPAIHSDIASFRQAFEGVRQEEVGKALARMPHLSNADREVVDKLATRLMNRVLHGPTQRLRSLPAEVREQFLEDFMAGLKESGVGSR